VKVGEWGGDRESRKGGMENTGGTKPPGVWGIIILFSMPTPCKIPTGIPHLIVKAPT